MPSDSRICWKRSYLKALCSVSKKSRAALVAMMLLLCATGCDTAVDPIQENDRHYSIFGYLNASADTQWIRVEALRDSLPIGAPAELNADVTLTDTATGQTAALRDSLFRYLDGTTAHNFYTTFDVEPTGTYRLAVRDAAGTESSAQVTLPDTFPTPAVIAPVDPFSIGCSPYDKTTIVEIRGIERLVAVHALYYLTGSEGDELRVRTFEHLDDAEQITDGSLRASINYVSDLCEIEAGHGGHLPEVLKIEVMVAAGNSDWPDFMSLDPETAALPDVASNVEGGTGLLGGIVTDTVVVYPFEW